MQGATTSRHGAHRHSIIANQTISTCDKISSGLLVCYLFFYACLSPHHVIRRRNPSTRAKFLQLFKEILKVTDANHPDRNNLLLAASIVKRMLTQVCWGFNCCCFFLRPRLSFSSCFVEESKMTRDNFFVIFFFCFSIYLSLFVDRSTIRNNSLRNVKLRPMQDVVLGNFVAQKLNFFNSIGFLYIYI